MHMMIDIETLSTRVDAHILSMAWVGFVPGESIIEYTATEVIVAPDQNRHIDPHTVLWWLKQSKEAQASFLLKPTESLIQALRMIENDLKVHDVEGIWSKGSSFDNAIINNAAQQFLGHPIISHKIDRCYRTLEALYPEHPIRRSETAVKHSALDDAVDQANHAAFLLGLSDG